MLSFSQTGILEYAASSFGREERSSDRIREGLCVSLMSTKGGVATVVAAAAKHGCFPRAVEQTLRETVLNRMGQGDNERTVVLFVEDEPLVRMFGADVLEEAGFEVLEAVDGDAALAVLAARPDIDVLFTDVNMPGSLDGLDLARLVHARRPDIKLLIASGQVRLSEHDIPDAGRFLPKPYAPDAIVREIRGLVA